MRALVLDQGLDRGSLAAVRALHDDGWSVGVGSPFRGLSGTSRFAERWHEVPAAEGGVGDNIDAVADAVAEGSYRVVFSADDIGVLGLSRHRHEIGAVVPYADHATVVRSVDKLEMTRAAERGPGSPCRRRSRPPTMQSPRSPSRPSSSRACTLCSSPARLGGSPRPSARPRTRLEAVRVIRARASVRSCWRWSTASSPRSRDHNQADERGGCRETRRAGRSPSAAPAGRTPTRATAGAAIRVQAGTAPCRPRDERR